MINTFDIKKILLDIEAAENASLVCTHNSRTIPLIKEDSPEKSTAKVVEILNLAKKGLELEDQVKTLELAAQDLQGRICALEAAPKGFIENVTDMLRGE